MKLHIPFLLAAMGTLLILGILSLDILLIGIAELIAIILLIIGIHNQTRAHDQN